jgi:hypothetical protein
MAIKSVSNQQIINPNKDKQEQLNRQIVERNTNIAGYFGTSYNANESLNETLGSNNISFLFPGDHKGYFSKNFSIVKGLNSSSFSGLVTVEAGKNIIFDGVTFVQGKETPNYLVYIKEGAKVIFSNCSFIRIIRTNTNIVGNVTTTTAKFVMLETTVAGQDMATFSGCIFQSEGDSGANEIVGRVNAGNGDAFVFNSINATNPAVPYGVAVVATGGNL